MADPHAVTPEALEILIARDLRKTGLALGRVRRRELTRAGRADAAGAHESEADPVDADPVEFRLSLTADLSAPAVLLVMEAYRRAGPLGEEAVREHAGRLRAEGSAERARAGLVVCTGGFSRAAVKAAAEARIALLRVADARAAFDASGWGPPGHYPPWLPAHVLEMATRGPTGAPAYRMLEPGSASSFLEALGLAGG